MDTPQTVVDINPFYKWLAERAGSKWFKVIAFTFLPTFLVFPLAEFLDVSFANRHGYDLFPNYNLVNISLNIAVTLTALLFVFPYYRHFDTQLFLKHLQRDIKENDLFLCTNMDDSEIIKNTNTGAYIHILFSNRIIVFYALIIVGYVAALFEEIALNPLAVHVYEFLQVAVNNVVIIVLLSTYYSLTFYNHRNWLARKILVYILIALVLLTIAHWLAVIKDFDTLNLACHAISGTLAGVSFAMLIGKLDSPIIRTPTSLLALMFSYAVIQALFVFFAVEGFHYTVYLTYPCLILKCIMFVYFYWLLRENRIIMHFLISPTIDRKLLIDLPRMEGIFEETYGHRDKETVVDKQKVHV